MYVFESCLGYNPLIRLGKIYEFSPETIIYVLETNPDLKIINHYFKLVSRLFKTYILRKKIRKYFTPKVFYEIQLGKKTITQVMNRIQKL